MPEMAWLLHNKQTKLAIWRWKKKRNTLSNVPNKAM